MKSEIKNTLIGLGLFLAVATIAKAEESNNVIPPKKPNAFVEKVTSYVNINEPNNGVTVFLKNEWEDIKYHQRHSWKEAGEQLDRNKDQLKGHWDTVAKGVASIFGATKKDKDGTDKE